MKNGYDLEGNVLFNDTLNTFHLRLCGVGGYDLCRKSYSQHRAVRM